MKEIFQGNQQRFVESWTLRNTGESYRIVRGCEAIFRGIDNTGSTWFYPALDGYDPCWLTEHCKTTPWVGTYAHGASCDWSKKVLSLRDGLEALLRYRFVPGYFLEERLPRFDSLRTLARREHRGPRLERVEPEEMDELRYCPVPIATWETVLPFHVGGIENASLYHAVYGSRRLILRRLDGTNRGNRLHAPYEDLLSVAEAAEMLHHAPEAWFQNWSTRTILGSEPQQNAA